MHSGLQDQPLSPLKFSLNKNSGATTALHLALTSELSILMDRENSPSLGYWSVPLALCCGPALLAIGLGSHPFSGPDSNTLSNEAAARSEAPRPRCFQHWDQLPPTPRKARSPGAGPVRS